MLRGMGAIFSKPKVPEALPAPASATVGDTEAKRKAKDDRRKNLSSSSFEASKVAGAVNSSYFPGTKTSQGQ